MLQEPFSMYPVVNLSGKLVGMIPKRFVVILLEHHAWYEHASSFEGLTCAEFFGKKIKELE